MDEAGRPPLGSQRPLPLAAIEEADAAYLDAVAELQAAGLGRCASEILRWIIRAGRRGQPGVLASPRATQRDLSKLLGFSQSSVCSARAKLKHSRLVAEADGEYRLFLPWLVELAEEARSRRQMALAPDLALSPAEALGLIGADRQRSALIGADRSRSAPRPFRKETNLNPVTVSVMDSALTDTDGTGATDHGRSRPIGTDQNRSLKELPPWQRLQTRDFRPVLQIGPLRAAFYAACQAGLIDDSDECKIRFLATAYDLAHDAAIRSPAAVLRVRTEGRRCYRISDEGNRWAKQILRPAEYASPNYGD